MTAGRLSLLAAMGVLLAGGATAQAADLGGDCCADLEERVAELEATTARKGNRKVSLTISGWVNEAVFGWDDGHESNVYVGTNSLEQDRVKFSGEAKISDDWSAGYTIELGINGDPSNGWSQNALTGASGTFNNITTRKASWFLKSKSLGKVTVGQDGMATYHLLDDADGVNTRNYSDFEAAAVYMGAFQTRSGGVLNGTGAEWKDFFGGFNNGTPGQSGRRNVVRYDSPTFAGFTASASWGEDDMWDTKLAYKGELGDFKVLGQVGYGEATDVAVGAGCSAGLETDCSWWGAAGTILHAPTGLFVYGGYGEQQNDLSDTTDSSYLIQAGIERKWIPLGKTTVFGEYRHDDVERTDSEFDFYAAGIVQNIENAAMDLYVMYRHAEGDFGDPTIDDDDFDMVITGARIQF